MTARAFVDAWIAYLLAAFGTKDTAAYLLLMRRLRTDPSLEDSLRRTLDVAEPELRRAPQLTFPGSPEAAVDFVLQSSRIVLVTAMAGDDALPCIKTPDMSFDMGLIVTYLASGIEASLNGAP